MPLARAALLPLALSAALLAGAAAPPEPQKPATDPPAKAEPALPLIQWSGSASKHEPGFFLIQSETAWENLWWAHSGMSTLSNELQSTQYRYLAPRLDFKRLLVVAYFRGPAPNHNGELALSLEELPDRVVLRFRSSTFGAFGPTPAPGAADTAPFGLWVLPRTDKPIVIEESRRDRPDAEPTPHEVKRFAPTAPDDC